MPRAVSPLVRRHRWRHAYDRGTSPLVRAWRASAGPGRSRQLRTSLWPRYRRVAGCGAGSWSAWPGDVGRVGWLGLVDRGGARAVALVVVAVRTRPLEAAVVGHLVAPGGVGLEAVVEPAQRGEVVGRRRTRLWSPLCLGVVVVRDRRGRCRSRGPGGCTTGTRKCGRGESPAPGSGRGPSYAGVESWALRSITGLTVTLVRESPHQSLTWSSRTSRWPSSIRPVGPNTVARPSRDASKCAWRTTSRAAGRC